jgi:hypothetical protein
MEEVCLTTLAEGEEATIDRASAGVDQAIAAGILRPVSGDLATVEHGLLQSYLASRGLHRLHGNHAIVEAVGRAEVEDAIRLFAGRVDRQQHARSISERLLSGRSELSPDRRPMRVAITAADVVHGARIDAGAALRAIRERWSAASPLERCDAVERVAKFGTPEAILFLWDKCRDADYRVRWSVAQGIVGNPFSAGLLHATLGAGIDYVFDGAERLAAERRDVDDWEPEVLSLKTLAWMLPALELGTRDPAERELLAADMNHLLFLLDGREQPGHPAVAGFDGVTRQLGLEASVAQGFRVAARAWPPDQRCRRAAPSTRSGLGR